MDNVAISPRRLGHVNLWVSELERSIQFYEHHCGLQLVRRERDLNIAFHSNGSTHHDIGLVETSKGVDRRGRDGTIQIPKTRGLVAGLNHIGWEMESEKQLVEGFQRAQASGVRGIRTVDHIVSHSMYLSDPDGNTHEFYADQIRDWRQIFNLNEEGELTAPWEPSILSARSDPRYVDTPRIIRIDQAPAHPRNLAEVTLATHQLAAMRAFYEDIAGLTVLRELDGATRGVVYGGTAGRSNLVLLQVAPDRPCGFRSFTFAVGDAIDERAAKAAFADRGIDAIATQSSQGEKELAIKDPDGFEVHFRLMPREASWL